jgi:hypothetical protein
MSDLFLYEQTDNGSGRHEAENISKGRLQEIAGSTSPGKNRQTHKSDDDIPDLAQGSQAGTQEHAGQQDEYCLKCEWNIRQGNGNPGPNGSQGDKE